ncbi:MAG: hypothetical protein IKO33_08190 [Bacteroidaceae bacterium]|nr:hypothetical protein [Bacteroidaceae bacterium]
MAKKENKLKLGIRGILGIACVAVWLICVYGQIKEDVGIAHQQQVPYRFMDSLGSICTMMVIILIAYFVILGFAGMFFPPDKNKKER